MCEEQNEIPRAHERCKYPFDLSCMQGNLYIDQNLTWHDVKMFKTDFACITLFWYDLHSVPD